MYDGTLHETMSRVLSTEPGHRHCRERIAGTDGRTASPVSG
ncbi:hypothetical protein HSR122_2411 [Halapricum desulfuricans]|uniref:Uncharacterized protein n=1 Tax=Halapricum desulfuricans TaxID=2841257 RepID=A0A897NBH8_9EURY|nr:hypothetical protein HSR122_2411 [Halapricum desulfuricans]